MNGFLDAIDLSANLERGLRAIRGIIGLPALVLGLALALICVGLSPLIWFFDLDATLQATEQARQFVLPTLPAALADSVALIALALTLLPTFVELFGARFATVGIRVAAGLVYFFSAFDALTDWPRVQQFMEAYRSWFDGLGFFATPAFWVVRGLFLFMATFGFEVIFVVFAVCAMVLLINSRRAPAPSAGGHF